MDPTSGKFTTPVPGMYFLSVQINKNGDSNPPTNLYLHANGIQAGFSYFAIAFSSQHCAIAATLSLKKGDRVTPVINGNKVTFAEFTGLLIEETL